MINYERIAKSISFYEERGFTRIESPWTVTEAISNITRPPDSTNWTISEKNKVLVASGEQSFLYLSLKGFLSPGKYQTVTPCFRNDGFDQFHTKYFIKNELINTQNTSKTELEKMVECAHAFFKNELNETIDIHYLVDGSIDLECKGIELGSYGVRECSFLKWIYGTGCAEPRMSQIKKILENGISHK